MVLAENPNSALPRTQRLRARPFVELVGIGDDEASPTRARARHIADCVQSIGPLGNARSSPSGSFLPCADDTNKVVRFQECIVFLYPKEEGPEQIG